MKILIDQNISYRILPLLIDRFPEIEHVRSFGLEFANDHDIFMFARNNNFQAIITLDDDFNYLQILHGSPPKTIWLRGKNSPTKSIAAIINQRSSDICTFLFDTELDILEILK